MVQYLVFHQLCHFIFPCDKCTHAYLCTLYRIMPTCHLSQICLHKFGYVSWTTTYWRDKENKNIIYLYVMLWNLLFISILYKTHKTTEIEEYLQHNPPFFLTHHPSNPTLDMPYYLKRSCCLYALYAQSDRKKVFYRCCVDCLQV